MTQIGRAAGSGGTRLAGLGLAGLVAVGALTAAPAALGADADFGTVSVGSTRVINRDVDLVTTLSGMDPAVVVYAGGNAAFDLVLGTMGLTVPLTAGALYASIGEVTATYHLALALADGTHFVVSAPDCLTGTGSCTAELTFEPVAPGNHADSVTASVVDLLISGDSTYATLLDFLAPSLESSIEGTALIGVTGIGVPASGTVTAQVDVAPSAACVELSTSSVSFGALSLGDEDQPASPLVTITNCSGGDETLYAAGTDATAPDAAWSLTDEAVTCGSGLALDTYRLRIASTSFEPELELSTASKPVQGLEAAATADHELRIFTACPGSTGAGKTMTMSVNYVVVAG